VFVTVNHFNSSLIFTGKARSLHLKQRFVLCSTQVGCSITCKYQTGVEVTDRGKHSSLLQNEINNERNFFYITGYFHLNLL